MTNTLERRLEAELEQFIRDGVYKRLNYLDSPQGPRVQMEGRGEVIILSSNNYLGLSDAARGDRGGQGRARPLGRRHRVGALHLRHLHRAPRAGERVRPARRHRRPRSRFVSAWNANEALPATLLGEDDIVISDQLNHASIIDGVRLAKAITKCQTAVYKHADLADLDAKLTAARDRRVRLVITDGVFSMEGAIAKLPDLLEICRKHHAVLMVDDSHATGVLGATGRGTAEHFGVRGRGGHHHLHARQGARRRGRRIRRRPRPPCATTSPSGRGRSSSPTRCRPPWRRARSRASSTSRPTRSG